jgi:hypothetical protein
MDHQPGVQANDEVEDLEASALQQRCGFPPIQI